MHNSDSLQKHIVYFALTALSETSLQSLLRQKKRLTCLIYDSRCAEPFNSDSAWDLKVNDGMQYKVSGFSEG